MLSPTFPPQHLKITDTFFSLSLSLSLSISTQFIRFPSLIFVILYIYFRPSIEILIGALLISYTVSQYFIIPITPLLPFFKSSHLTTNHCHIFRTILLLSFDCFLILITLLPTIFKNPLPYLFFI